MREEIKEVFRKVIAHTLSDGYNDLDDIAYQILKAFKEAGGAFVTSFVGTDYNKDGIPTVATEIKEIEL